MKESDFVSRNEESWAALERYTNITKADRAEIREFARLFRLAGFHLAYAKTHFPDGTTVAYLNSLVGKSHNLFYVPERGTFSLIREYFSHTLPQTVRETWKYWVLATAIFVFGVFFAGFYVAGDTARFAEIMPAQFAAGFTPGEVPYLGDGSVDWDGAVMSAFFIANNTAVAFNAFAWGLLAGAGTLWVLFYNGVIVGGLFGFFHSEGADMLVAYSLVLPHGVLELAAIFLAGGGGLMLGKGLLLPGEFSRLHSLILHAKKAAKLVPAIVIMLALAAFIEGFFTPLAISPWIKLAFAGLTGVGMVAYFLKGARTFGKTQETQ